MNWLDRLDPDIFFLRAEVRYTRWHKDKLPVRHSRVEVHKSRTCSAKEYSKTGIHTLKELLSPLPSICLKLGLINSGEQ